MNIVLVQPPAEEIIEAVTPEFTTPTVHYYPPLGLLSLATCVNEWTSHRAEVLDASILGLRGDRLRLAIKQKRPDVVGLPLASLTLPGTLKVAHLVKEADPDIPVVVGGSHATAFPAETALYEDVDFVVTGEGEVSFTRLLEHLEGSRAIKEVPGVIGTEGGKTVAGSTPEVIRDLDMLPIPDRSLTPHMMYKSIFAEHTPTTIMMTTRGCPYHCSFCYPTLKIRSHPFRCRSPMKMVEEMRACAKLGIREVFFYDDTFTADRARIIEFCRLLADEDLGIRWDVKTRVDCIDRELMEVMKRAGLRRIQMGVESGTQAGLDVLRKDITLNEIEKGFSLAKEAGLETMGYVMLGLPGETRDMRRESIRFSLRIPADYMNYTLFTPLPGTPLWDQILASGDTSLHDAWKDFVDHPTPEFDPPLYNTGCTRDELTKDLNMAYRAFYLRPRYVLQEVRRIRTPRQLLLKLAWAERIPRYLLARRASARGAHGRLR